MDHLSSIPMPFNQKFLYNIQPGSPSWHLRHRNFSEKWPRSIYFYYLCIFFVQVARETDPGGGMGSVWSFKSGNRLLGGRFPIVGSGHRCTIRSFAHLHPPLCCGFPPRSPPGTSTSLHNGSENLPSFTCQQANWPGWPQQTPLLPNRNRQPRASHLPPRRPQSEPGLSEGMPPLWCRVCAGGSRLSPGPDLGGWTQPGPPPPSLQAPSVKLLFQIPLGGVGVGW